MKPKIISAPTSSPSDLANFGMAVLEHAPLPMASVEGPGHIVREVNAAFCQLLGRPRETFVGKPFYPLLREQGLSLEVLDRVFRTGQSESQTEEQIFERPSVFWTYTLWPMTAQAQPIGIVVQITVTTKHQKQTVAVNEALVLSSVHQHELTEASEHLNTQLREEIAARLKTERILAERARLLDLSTDAILVLDLDHKIRYWNRGATELYGWSREEALGKISHVLLGTQSAEPFEKITEILATNSLWTGELLHTKRDGERISVLVRKVVDRDKDGNAVAILESMTDITERNKTVEALREAQARLAEHAEELERVVTRRTAELTASNQQLEAIVYSMAHDLRAPLRAMQGFSTMLVDEASTALSESGREYAHRIDQSAQFMDALLSDLLAYTRTGQQRISLAPVSVEKVVGSVLSRVQKEIARANAFIECSGPWPEVQAHEPTLALVLYNLLGNALKFVRTGVVPLVGLHAEERGDSVRIWVEDNGLGIAPDYQEQIFRLFIRLDRGKYPGTGAGLAIVQKGVERMGGRVGVDSKLGEGSKFWIELPKAAPRTDESQ